MSSHPYAAAISAAAVGVGATEMATTASTVGPSLDPGIVAVILGIIGLVPQIISLFKKKTRKEA